MPLPRCLGHSGGTLWYTSSVPVPQNRAICSNICSLLCGKDPGELVTVKGFASCLTLLLRNGGQLGSLPPAAGPAASPQRGVTCSVSHLGLEIPAALAQASRGDTRKGLWDGIHLSCRSTVKLHTVGSDA